MPGPAVPGRAVPTHRAKGGETSATAGSPTGTTWVPAKGWHAMSWGSQRLRAGSHSSCGTGAVLQPVSPRCPGTARQLTQPPRCQCPGLPAPGSKPRPGIARTHQLSQHLQAMVWEMSSGRSGSGLVAHPLPARSCLTPSAARAGTQVGANGPTAGWGPSLQQGA